MQQDAAQVQLAERDEEGLTPLMYASRFGDAARITALLALDAAAQLAARDNRGWTALMLSAGTRYGDAERVTALLAQDAAMQLAAVYDDGLIGEFTTLMIAARARYGDAARITALLVQDAAAQLAACDDMGQTALIHAATGRSGDVASITALLAQDAAAQLAARDDNGRTALMNAAAFGDAERGTVLLAQHAAAQILARDNLHKPQFQMWDDRIQWVLERSMGFQPREVTWQQFSEGEARFVLSGAALQQARLPVRHGGLGVISAAQNSHAAYTACCVAALPEALADRAAVRGPGGGAEAALLAPTEAAAVLDVPLVHSLTAALQALRGKFGAHLGYKDGKQTAVPQHLWQFCTAEGADAAAAQAPLAVRGGAGQFGVQAELTERLATKSSGDLLRYLRVPVTLESHVPFVIGGVRHDPAKRMDIVLPHGAFGGGEGDNEESGQEGEQGGARPREHMLDLSVVEVQCASHVANAVRDPSICTTKREKEKKDHYSEFYDQDCYTLATVAIGSFGFLGREAVKVVQAMANAYAAREFRGEEGGIRWLYP
ncbi:ankyrin repeat-containing domain protein [Tribonema minus]|uniref:Ankyrin repeat-containing domain protein n=1 Tax=Tribonema minus TaxID=303371 RepID=A0A835YSH1_9STRA|nr:ankyrin repeat-containing domain protein [Tribonema minus]